MEAHCILHHNDTPVDTLKALETVFTRGIGPKGSWNRARGAAGTAGGTAGGPAGGAAGGMAGPGVASSKSAAV